MSVEEGDWTLGAVRHGDDICAVKIQGSSQDACWGTWQHSALRKEWGWGFRSLHTVTHLTHIPVQGKGWRLECV